MWRQLGPHAQGLFWINPVTCTTTRMDDNISQGIWNWTKLINRHKNPWCKFCVETEDTVLAWKPRFVCIYVWINNQNPFHCHVSLMRIHRPTPYPKSKKKNLKSANRKAKVREKGNHPLSFGHGPMGPWLADKNPQICIYFTWAFTL